MSVNEQGKRAVLQNNSDYKKQFLPSYILMVICFVFVCVMTGFAAKVAHKSIHDYYNRGYQGVSKLVSESVAHQLTQQGEYLSFIASSDISKYQPSGSYNMVNYSLPNYNSIDLKQEFDGIYMYRNTDNQRRVTPLFVASSVDNDLMLDKSQSIGTWIAQQQKHTVTSASAAQQPKADADLDAPARSQGSAMLLFGDAIAQLGFLQSDFMFLIDTKLVSEVPVVLMGVSSFDRLTLSALKGFNNDIATFEISDGVTGQVLAMHKNNAALEDMRANGYAEQGVTPDYKYDVIYMGKTFEITMRFIRSNQAISLDFAPHIITIIGVILAFTIMFLLWIYRRRSFYIDALQHELLQKDKALQSAEHKQERTTAAAKVAQQENRVIIDSVSDVIFEMDSGGKFVFLNAQWMKITGFEIEQSIGQALESVVHQQDQDDITEKFVFLVNGKIEKFRKFTQLRMSDGSFRAVELSMSYIQHKGETSHRFIGSFTDIEDRRKAERALGEAEKKYRNIVQNAAGGIFQLTAGGVYLSVNPAMANILGYETPGAILREVKNANEDVYIDPDARKILYTKIAKQGGFLSHDTQVKTCDGALIWVNENIHAVYDENGEVLYFEGGLENITARKETALALENAKLQSDLANRAKSEFLANMSHELRTPLNSIIGFSEMIKNEVFGELVVPEYWEYARDINQSGKNLLNVINEILDISKIEAGDRQLNEGQVELDQLALTCLELLQTKIGNNDLVVHNNLAMVPNIVGESLAVKQVLMNILSNAVKFTPKNGRISLSYEIGREGELNLSITDTGIGLDEDEIRKARSAFGQIDNELSRSGSGTGLGLTLVDSLMKLHGGEFKMISQKGIGTTATIIFPTKRVLPPKKSAGNAPASAAKNMKDAKDTKDENAD